MKIIASLLFAILILSSCSSNSNLENNAVNAQESSSKATSEISKSTVNYPSTDGLLITADLYQIDETSDYMILFHRAGWSRGEYKDTALVFNGLGYNVLAVDQRYGKAINGVKNETASRAKEDGYPSSMEDASRDLIASVLYVRDELNSNSIYVLGSSYSSSLVLIISQPFQDVIKGVISFSPGEYFSYKGQTIADAASKLAMPVFITSAKNEVKDWSNIFNSISSENKIGFKPESSGRHGSESLWASTKGNAEYWDALITFLNSTKNLE